MRTYHIRPLVIHRLGRFPPSPWKHLLAFRVPFIYFSLSNVVLIVILGATSYHGTSESDVDPSLVRFATFSFGNAVQPVRLGFPSHKYHVAAGEGEFQGCAGLVARVLRL